ncbi:MAG TPA: chaperone modulator CbpM [Flavobacteriaceae bacterium]|nr:chaperone modulator CbpM [Flavobacteriaceae bacterium]
MDFDELIEIREVLTRYKVNNDFITCIEQCSIIDYVEQNNTRYIYVKHIPKVEQIIRLHNDLNVNMEGIEAISHLLDRIENLQNKLRIVEQKLKIYE